MRFIREGGLIEGGGGGGRNRAFTVYFIIIVVQLPTPLQIINETILAKLKCFDKRDKRRSKARRSLETS